MGKTSIFSTAFLFVCLFLFSSTKQNKKILFSCTYIFSLSGKGEKKPAKWEEEERCPATRRKNTTTRRSARSLGSSGVSVQSSSPLLLLLLLLIRLPPASSSSPSLLSLAAQGVCKHCARTGWGTTALCKLPYSNLQARPLLPPPPPSRLPPPPPPPPLSSPSLPPSLLAAGLRLQGPRANQRRAAWELANDITAGQWRRSPDLIWFLLRF